jgi:hypothetical protein
LHTLNEQAAKEEIQDLKELMQYLKSHDDVIDERLEELKTICIDCKINSPFLGEQ